jgi:hypothetical protein
MKLKPAALFGVMPEGHPASNSITSRRSAWAEKAAGL